MRNCRNCGDLPLNHFRPACKSRYCTSCLREQDRARYEERREYKAEYDRLRKYGLSQGSYEQLLKEQNNECAICHKPFIKAPHVDHCHSEGHVRGLLCVRCNLGIGYFDDDIDTLHNVINYLKI